MTTGLPPVNPCPARTHWAVLRDAPFGVPWHDAGLWNVNLLALRSQAEEDSNRFDDAIVASYRAPGPNGSAAWVTQWWRCTTDAGKPYREDPLHPRGCAVIAPGHYHLSHALGSHNGRPALRQVGPLSVWRVPAGRPLDRSRPTVAAPASCALNIHDGPAQADRPVDRWSAGCIVLPGTGLVSLLALVERQRSAGMGDRVSLTLVETRDNPVASNLLALVLDEIGGGT